MSTSPKSGSKVKEGNTINIIVSSFEDTIKVEDYTNENLETIKTTLESQGIRVVVKSEKVTKDDNIEENTIISQNVKPGERLQKETGVIELVYATLIVVYPDFTDGTYTKDLVQQFCDDNEITCTFIEEENNHYNEGAIWYQSRTMGTEVKDGTTLRVKIATNSKVEELTTNKEEPEE